MTPLDATIDDVLAGVRPLGGESVPLRSAIGAVLVDTLVAGDDGPPFDAAAMDGYAVRSADLASAPVSLQVTGVSSCGRPSEVVVTAGTAVRILTGAVVPSGADCVVPVESTDAGVDRVRVAVSSDPGAHVRRRGDLVRRATPLIAAGTYLHAGHVALAAGEGLRAVRVVARPRVAVVATGDELVPAGTELAAGQIHDSNSELMAGLVTSTGADVTVHTTGDDVATLTRLLERLAASHDLVLTSGGVSMGGEYDPLRAALADHDVEFRQVAIKPAKPLAFGSISSGPVSSTAYVGLPGNPVSVVVAFELFARPVIDRLGGRTGPPHRLRTGVAASDIVGGDTDRTNLLPVRLTGAGAWEPIGRRGSHALGDVVSAGALALLGPGTLRVERGEELTLLPLWI